MSETITAEKKDVTATSTEAKTDTKVDTSSSQNPIRKELDKVKKPKSELEKLLFTKKSIDARLAEITDQDGSENNGEVVEEDDNKPLTHGDLKRMQKDQAKLTAKSLADEQVKDADELELVKHYLDTRIVPSGNALDDLRLARAAVNSLKNEQIAEEVSRGSRKITRNTSSGSGAPAKVDDAFEATPEELSMAKFAKVPADKQQEWIKNARKKYQTQ